MLYQCFHLHRYRLCIIDCLICTTQRRIYCYFSYLLKTNMKNKNLNKYLPLLQLLTRKHFTRESFNAIIQSLDDKAIKFICECIQNAISVQHISRLNKRKKKCFLKKIIPSRCVLKYLCKKAKKYTRHRKLIVQKGYGFLVPILSTIIPLITSLLASH